MARCRFPQGPTRSRPVGKLQTFGVVLEEPLCQNWDQKSVFLAILSSVAAGLPSPFYLASTSGCKEKDPTRLGTGFASRVTWGFFPFCQVRFAPLTNRRPKGGEIVPCGHKLPCLPRPYGACLLDVCADADTAPRYRPPQTNIQAYGLFPLRLQCHMKHPATHLIPSHK